MMHMYLHAKFIMNMFGQMLGTIDTSMLTTRTSETEHQTGKTTLDISEDMSIGQTIDTLQEGENLSIVLQETDDRLIQSGKVLIGFVSARIMRTSAVKHISSSVSAGVGRNTLTERETPYIHHQRSTAIIFAEGGWTILGMSRIWSGWSRTVSIGTGLGFLLLGLKLRKVHHTRQHIMQVRIRASTIIK